MRKTIRIDHIKCPLTGDDVNAAYSDQTAPSPGSPGLGDETAKQSEDRVFDALRKHYSSNKAFIDFCQQHDDPSSKQRHREMLNREWKDWCAVCETVPETLLGAASLARYVANWTNRSRSLLYNPQQSATLQSLAEALERLAGVNQPATFPKATE